MRAGLKEPALLVRRSGVTASHRSSGSNATLTAIMMIASRPALLALLLAGAFIFVACNGDDEPAREASADTAPGTPAVTEPAPTAPDATDSLGELSMEAFAVPAGS